jgi:hypothetical protein
LGLSFICAYKSTLDLFPQIKKSYGLFHVATCFLHLKIYDGWVWLYAPVIPATREVVMGGSTIQAKINK